MSSLYENQFNEACKDINDARRFVNDVSKLAKKYNANYFIVTDGASGISNNGNPVVRAARKAHEDWERKHGADPDEDWIKDGSFKEAGEEIINEVGVSIGNNLYFSVVYDRNRVEGFFGRPYFKVYNANSHDKADKVIRLYFNEVAYTNHKSGDGKTNWYSTMKGKDKKNIYDTLCTQVSENAILYDNLIDMLIEECEGNGYGRMNKGRELISTYLSWKGKVPNYKRI